MRLLGRAEIRRRLSEDQREIDADSIDRNRQAHNR